LAKIGFFVKVLYGLFLNRWIFYIFTAVKVWIGQYGERVNIFLIIMLSSSLGSLLDSCKLNLSNKPITFPFRIHCLCKSLLLIRWFLFLTKVTIFRKFEILRNLRLILFYGSSWLNFRKYCISSWFLLIIQPAL